MADSQQHRVVLWGTGAIGSELLTAILDHRPDLQIAGARVYSPDKNGADIATVLDRSPIGVTATTDVEEILALDADCVLYTPRNTSIDEVCATWRAGKTLSRRRFCSIRSASTRTIATDCVRPARPGAAAFTAAD